MSEATYQMLIDALERDVRECDTPEKARALLQSEGLVDAEGYMTPMYSDRPEIVWQ